MAADIGVDFLVKTPGGATCVVQTKHTINAVHSGRQLRETLRQLQNAQTLLAADEALLIVPAVIPAEARAFLDQVVNYRVWDGVTLEQLVSKHHQIESEIAALFRERPTARSRPSVPVHSRAAELSGRLRALPAGSATWRSYEDLCLEILNHVFIPPLKTPRIQSASDDGLDRRDAIYAIGSGNPFWDALKAECRTLFVVVDFKNGGSSPAQRDVESLQQYLWPQALRSFGILCTRLPAEQSALIARRRAWVEFGKLIVLLCDSDVQELLAIRSGGADASSIIETQLDDFFTSLSP